MMIDNKPRPIDLGDLTRLVSRIEATPAPQLRRLVLDLREIADNHAMTPTRGAIYRELRVFVGAAGRSLQARNEARDKTFGLA
jgi:hypothetical protein